MLTAGKLLKVLKQDSSLRAVVSALSAVKDVGEGGVMMPSVL